MFEVYPSAKRFYSFMSPYTYEYREEGLVRSTSVGTDFADACLMSTRLKPRWTHIKKICHKQHCTVVF